MQQITLELESGENDRPTLTLEPEREQRIIALMAQIIAAAVRNREGEDHESE